MSRVDRQHTMHLAGSAADWLMPEAAILVEPDACIFGTDPQPELLVFVQGHDASTRRAAVAAVSNEGAEFLAVETH